MAKSFLTKRRKAADEKEKHKNLLEDMEKLVEKMSSIAERIEDRLDSSAS